MTQPSEPVWDGEGADPWLPTRLAHVDQLVSGERSVYDDYFSKLARWLVEVRRGVLSGPRVDPNVLWRYVPRWLQEMTDFVHDTLAEVVGIAYRNIFGPGYRYDQRPFVVQYLAQAENRLRNTPDEVYDLIVGQVAEGATAGESLTAIAERIGQVLSPTENSAYWQNRAVTVARTETLGAYNAGREGAFRQVAADLEEPFESMWLATADTRTRPAHREADLQRVPLGQPFLVGGELLARPGDPSGSASNVINCVPGDTLVSFPGLRAVMRRSYQGDLVKLRFAAGDELSVTPNHPILRANGIWTPAGQFQEGDHCIRAISGGWATRAPDENGGPTEIGEVYRLAQIAGQAERVRGVPPDFHGDGADGEVEIVPVGGGLGFDDQAASEEQLVQFGLALAAFAGSALRQGEGGAVASPGARDHSSDHVFGGSPSAEGPSAFTPARGGHQLGGLGTVSLGAAEHAHPRLTEPGGNRAAADPRGLGDGQNAVPPLVPRFEVGQVDGESVQRAGLPQVPDVDAVLAEVAADGHRGHAQILGQGLDALAGLVTLAKIVNVERYAFTGHVYNLDAGDGWYAANGIVCRNCRCTTLLVRPGETLDLSDRQLDAM